MKSSVVDRIAKPIRYGSVASSIILYRSYLFAADDHITFSGIVTDSGALSGLSAAAWIKTSDDSALIAGEWEAAGNARGWTMQVSSGNLRVNLSDDGIAVEKQYDSPSAVNTGVWRHIAFTFSSGTLRLYVDGSEVSATKNTDNACNSVYSGRGNYQIGRLIGSSALDYVGNLSECRVYSSELTSLQVAKLANLQEVPGANAYHQCNDTESSDAPDSSGNGNTGTKVNIDTGTFHDEGDYPGGFDIIL